MSIELKRKEMELKRVILAREEQEFKIEERFDEIKRLESMIEIQKKREEELIKDIATLSSNKGE